MPKSELLARLQEMHSELADINNDLKQVDHVDDQTVEVLGQLVSDVGNLVDQAHHVKETNQADDNQPNILRDRITEFETEHPRVTQFLAQISEVLASLGI